MSQDLFTKLNAEMIAKAEKPQKQVRNLELCGTFSAVVKTIIKRDGERISPLVKEYETGSLMMHYCLQIADLLPEVAGCCIWDSIAILPKAMDDKAAWNEKAVKTYCRAARKLLVLSGSEKLKEMTIESLESVTGYNRKTHELDKRVIITVSQDQENRFVVTQMQPFTDDFKPTINT